MSQLSPVHKTVPPNPALRCEACPPKRDQNITSLIQVSKYSKFPCRKCHPRVLRRGRLLEAALSAMLVHVPLLPVLPGVLPVPVRHPVHVVPLPALAVLIL